MAINPMDAQGGIAGAMPTAGGAMPQGMPQGTPQEGPAFEQTGRGTVGKDLLDALVAAKLLREKKMAQNQLMLSMKNDPQTVAEKNEAELQGLTQQEITKGVSGVLQNKQRKEQKNLQLAAKGQGRGQPRRGRSPQGAPRVAGIADNPRPNMAMMAQGGIVGFQEGQEVEGEKVDAETQNKIVEYVKENPWATALNTAALAALVAPVPGGRPLSGILKLGATGAKYAPKIAKVLGKAFTKPKPGLQGRGLNRVNTGQPMGEAAKRLGIADDVTAASRQFDPLRSAGVLGTAGGISSLMEGGGDEKIVEGKDDTKGTTPVATPPAVAQPTADSTLPTYDEKMMKIERALSQGGIGSFGKNMQAMDDAEAERAIESRKNELLAEYNSQVVDQRTLNQAQTQLLKYSAQLQALVGQDPSVLAAQRRLEAALDDEDESAIAAAQKEISNAQTLATAAIGKTPSGIALISQIAALRETLSKYQGGSGATQSADVAAALKAID